MRWLWIRINDDDPNALSNLRTSVPGEPASASGPELVQAWERGIAAITIRAGGLQLQQAGPYSPANRNIDTNEPYRWLPSVDDVEAAIAFFALYDLLPQAERDATTVELCITEEAVPNRPPRIFTPDSLEILLDTPREFTLSDFVTDDSDAFADLVIGGVTASGGRGTTAILANGVLTVTATDPDGDTFTVSFNVTDTDGATRTAMWTFEVVDTLTPEPNLPPVVTITTVGRRVVGNELVQLEAMTSDPDGMVVSHRWTGSGTFGDRDMRDTSWEAPAAGVLDTDYTLQLRARDDDGDDGFDAVTFTVTGIGEPPEGLELSVPSQIVEVGDTLVVDLANYVSNGDGTAIAYALTSVSGAWISVIISGSEVSITGVLETPDNTVAQVFVTASQSGTMVTDPINVTVVPVITETLAWDPGEPPNVSVDVGESHIFDLDDYIRNDTGDPTLDVSFSGVNSTRQTVDELSGNRIRVTGVSAGTDIWTLSVTAGGETISTSIRTIVSEGVVIPTPPSVTIHTQDQDVDGGTDLDLSATVTGEDSLQWTADGGTFDDATDEDATYTAPAALPTDEDYDLTLTATNSDGMTSRTITITVPGTGVTPGPTWAPDLPTDHTLDVGGSVTVDLLDYVDNPGSGGDARLAVRGQHVRDRRGPR